MIINERTRECKWEKVTSGMRKESGFQGLNWLLSTTPVLYVDTVLSISFIHLFLYKANYRGHKIKCEKLFSLLIPKHSESCALMLFSTILNEQRKESEISFTDQLGTRLILSVCVCVNLSCAQMSLPFFPYLPWHIFDNK